LLHELIEPNTFHHAGRREICFLIQIRGVCLVPRTDKKSVNYVFGPELVKWCSPRPRHLTLIFDQSYSRGSKDGIREKLAYFADENVYGFAYESHATFLLLATDSELVERARERVLEVSGLPGSRLVGLRSKKIQSARLIQRS
jgi:hypothetical protein